MSSGVRRARPVHVDPLALPPPGRCLRADGVYRRRMGWPQQPALLTELEVQQVFEAGRHNPYLTRSEYHALWSSGGDLP